VEEPLPNFICSQRYKKCYNDNQFLAHIVAGLQACRLDPFTGSECNNEIIFLRSFSRLQYGRTVPRRVFDTAYSPHIQTKGIKGRF
jgi:hypothetical protein